MLAGRVVDEGGGPVGEAEVWASPSDPIARSQRDNAPPSAARVEPDGAFVFYTNYDSAKGVQIAETGKAAFVLHWKSLRRQLRVRGTVTREEGAKADAYYASRALESRIGAWSSRQSQPLESRGALMAEVARQGLRHGLNPARPPFWGGFRIAPVQIEFWADGAFRLHDRFRWTLTAERRWDVVRLQP